MLESLEVATVGSAKQTIQIRKDGGFVQVELRTIKLKMLFSSKKSSNALVFVLYEPESGLFWREFQRGHYDTAADEQVGVSQFLKEYRFYLLYDKIIGFLSAGGDMFVLEYAGRQPSLDEAVRIAIAGIKPNLKPYGSPFQDTKIIYLRDIVGSDFCYEEMSAVSTKTPHLIDVDRQKPQWIINLEGPNENKALGDSVKDKAKVILSDDYTVQEAFVNGKKVFPGSRK